MNIGGFQKLTLLDYPGNVACTVFTSGCNFRCPFCHNASLVLKNNYHCSREEFMQFLSSRKGLLDGVCVTGGEPLLQPDISDFLEEIKSFGFLVKLDTNGSFPSKLKQLVKSGLVDYVAMDIKNSKESYPTTAGIDNLDLSAVCESVDFLLSDAVEYEFRTTCVKPLHSDSDMISIGKWIEGAKAYFLQQFVDSGDIIGEGLSAFSKEEMDALCNTVKQFVPSAALRGL